MTLRAQQLHDPVEYGDDDGNGIFSRIDCSGASAFDPGTYYIEDR